MAWTFFFLLCLGVAFAETVFLVIMVWQKWQMKIQQSWRQARQIWLHLPKKRQMWNRQEEIDNRQEIETLLIELRKDLNQYKRYLPKEHPDTVNAWGAIEILLSQNRDEAISVDWCWKYAKFVEDRVQRLVNLKLVFSDTSSGTASSPTSQTPIVIRREKSALPLQESSSADSNEASDDELTPEEKLTPEEEGILADYLAGYTVDYVRVWEIERTKSVALRKRQYHGFNL